MSDSPRTLPEWAYAFGKPALTGDIRVKPEDFRVEEILPFSLDGQGEHVWLHLQKTGTNTEFLAKALARFAGVHPRDVGYAGLKDRHAVTRQWFSVLMTGKAEPDWAALPTQFKPGEVAVLEVVRHGRKLKTGALKENRFVLTLRSLRGDVASLPSRIARVEAHGVPNYFGNQRFGRDASNLAGADRVFSGERIRDSHERGMYISAARSYLFNQVLSTRVTDGSWERLLPGEAVILNGSGSWFLAEPGDEALPGRLASFDIHPSGPLWGEGESPARDMAATLESSVLAELASWRAGLAALGLRQERRALRLRAGDLGFAQTGDAAVLSFALPAGCFATTVLRELVDFRDASGLNRE